MKNRSTGRLSRLLLNAVIPECFYRGSQPLKNTTRFPITTFGNDVARGYLRGFTLIELLVVVLIIGILSAIALPQYQMAVTKSRVATMLPLMRRWYDAMAMYKVENGYYCADGCPGSAELGVSWPADWECTGGIGNRECWNDQWYCFANEESLGDVHCDMNWLESTPRIQMSQPDDSTYPPGKRFCWSGDEKVCKALGGKEIPGNPGYYEF